MKILIDEQLPTKLKYRFNNTIYDVYTVRDVGWLGKKNGEMLQLMSASQFDILLTNDKNLYYQQKTDSLPFSIININTKTNRYDDILIVLDNIMNKLKEAELNLQSGQTGKYYVVDE